MSALLALALAAAPCEVGAEWRDAGAAGLDLPQGHPLPPDFALPCDAELFVTLVRR